MKTVISNLLSLNPQNVSPEIFWVLGIVYGVLLLVTFTSIFKTVDSLLGRLAWMVLTTAVPVGGMALYCVRCLWKADYSTLLQFLPKKNDKRAMKA